MDKSTNCSGTGCYHALPANSQFPYCEPCRILAAADAVRFAVDPHIQIPNGPSAESRARDLLHLLTGAELLSYVDNIEKLYFELKKVVYLNSPKPDKKVRKTLAEQVEETRERQNEEAAIAFRTKRIKEEGKVTKKKETIIQRQMRLLRITETEARKMFDTDLGEF